MFKSSFGIPDTFLRTLYYILVYRYLYIVFQYGHRLIPQTWNVLL